MSRWVRSHKARTVFYYSSWVVVCFGIFVVFVLSPWFHYFETMPTGVLFLRVLGGALGVVGVPATMIVWFGMVFFCAREDRSRVSVKILWFILFFAAGPFGSAAYFFRVYRKQVQDASG
jgi:hypothetical protein